MTFEARIKKWNGLFPIDGGLHTIIGQADSEQEFVESVMEFLAVIFHARNIRFEVTVQERSDDGK